MSGSATFTTVMSSNSMNVAVQTAMRVHHLRSSAGMAAVLPSTRARSGMGPGSARDSGPSAPRRPAYPAPTSTSVLFTIQLALY